MADSTITQLPALTSIADTDVLLVVDVSDTTQAATGTTKKITKANLTTGLATTTTLSSHTGNTDNPHTVTKTQVGLGNVDNTSDVNKPISSATQTALNNKAASDHNHDSAYSAANHNHTGVYSPTDHTHSYEPANANIQSHISDTNNPHAVDKTDVGLGNVTNDAQLPLAQKGVPSGVATLGEDGKVPGDQLPPLFGGSGDVTGPASSTPGTIAIFVDDTGKVITDSPFSPTSFAAAGHTHLEYEPANSNIQTHISDTTTNPHQVTAGQVGASPINHDHAGMYEPSNPGIVTHIGATGNPHSTTPADIGASATDHTHAGVYSPIDHAHAGVYSLTDHNHTGTYAPALGADDNYVTDAEKTVIGNTSGTNTGDEPDASTTVVGVVELTIATEVTTGSSATLAVTPDALAGSTIFGVKGIGCQVVADATDVDTTSGVWYFNVPQCLNGMNLLRANAYVTTAGTTNATTIQVRNMTKYSANDSLSTAISIASGGTTGTAGTVNASYDDVATDDLIKVYVTGQSTTKPKGLRVNLEYQLP